MAPEVILDGAPVDARADVYALGGLMYWMLTGHLVFEADSPMKMLLQHVETTPIPPSRRTELPVPPALDRIVLACLEKDPDRRPPHAEALLEMLDALPRPAWSRTAARRWWERHLVELTGPHVLAMPASPRGGRPPADVALAWTP
jgi:serine/threonine-protein kinase